MAVLHRGLAQLSLHFSDENRNRFCVLLFVIDGCCINGPVHARDRSCGQLLIQNRAIPNKAKAMALSHEHLHFNRMGSMGVILHLYTNVGQ